MSEKQKSQPINKQKTTIGKKLHFEASETYKRLRTNLQFVLPLKDGKRCRLIGVTSALAGEGKSTTSINLSYSLAESGKKVLLIEADLRLPTISKLLELRSATGLSDYLIAGDRELLCIKTAKDESNLCILSAGSLPPNPSELLETPRMGELLKLLAEDYDYIIIDLPPINIVADAAIVSKYVDGILMVVRQNYDKCRAVDAAMRSLEYANANVVGFIFNCVGKTHRLGKRYLEYGEYAKMV
ncbi:MAG: CpsD/CapB family tyrosine-protein kinase [Clostridia bacterium]|nr:CpsD/CapB family tyrosine-protein kinase [Clostridia bacterium]